MFYIITPKVRAKANDSKVSNGTETTTWKRPSDGINSETIFRYFGAGSRTSTRPLRRTMRRATRLVTVCGIPTTLLLPLPFPTLTRPLFITWHDLQGSSTLYPLLFTVYINKARVYYITKYYSVNTPLSAFEEQLQLTATHTIYRSIYGRLCCKDRMYGKKKSTEILRPKIASV
jgi:hypothetical protein